MNLSMPRLSWTKSIEVLLWVAALGVLVENIVLLRQNRGLQESLAPQIAGGTQLQMLSGLTLDGRIVPVGLSPAGSKLRVFTFSPRRPAWQANQPNWMSLASRLGQKWRRARVVGQPRPHRNHQGVLPQARHTTFRHIGRPPYRTYLQLGLAWVPNTLLVDASGVVEKVWAGCQAF